MKTILNRRQAIISSTAAGLAAGHARVQAAPAVRKRVALLATEVRKWSHAQHFLDRFLEGYGWEGQHHRPAIDLASLYLDQVPPNDLGQERARRHRFPIYPTIAEALTLGGSRLAVDGVLIIGEHGNYPTNEKGQKLYPRYRFFKDVIKVFEQSGRAVPVFNDKHLSTDFGEAAEMVADARRLGFPFLAGSSLPVTSRIPALEIPIGAALDESVVVGWGGPDSYDIHALEAAQAMSERRAGGETGVRSLQAVRGPKVWDMLRKRPSTTALIEAALARSHTLKAPVGYTVATSSIDGAERANGNPLAYFCEHNDGFRTSILLLDGIIQDFNYAGQVRGQGIVSCQIYLPMPPHQATLADFFNPQFHYVEDMILTGKAAYPIERTLLTTGLTAFAVESLHRGQILLPTPTLNISYSPPPGSLFWRT